MESKTVDIVIRILITLKNSSYPSHASYALSGKSQKLLSKVLSIFEMVSFSGVFFIRDQASLIIQEKLALKILRIVKYIHEQGTSN